MADQTAHNGRSNGGGSALTSITAKVRNLFRPRGDSLRESIEEVIGEHLTDSADFTPVERQMLMNIMTVGALRVDDVMVPRADVVAVDINTPLADLVHTFNEAAHSRLPIYRNTLDEPIGMVHIKDLVRLWFDADPASRSAFSLSEIRRDVLFAPPSMPVVDLLLKMRVTRTHMALVIDEYGGTDGLVTIEDLVEEIVGEIRDEHDPEGPMLVERPDGSFDADARVEVEELEQATGFGLVPDDKEEYADTLGGLVSSLIGRVPQRGELIAHPSGIEFEVVDADARAIKQLRVKLNSSTGTQNESEEVRDRSNG